MFEEIMGILKDSTIIKTAQAEAKQRILDERQGVVKRIGELHSELGGSSAKELRSAVTAAETEFKKAQEALKLAGEALTKVRRERDGWRASREAEIVRLECRLRETAPADCERLRDEIEELVSLQRKTGVQTSEVKTDQIDRRTGLSIIQRPSNLEAVRARLDRLKALRERVQQAQLLADPGPDLEKIRSEAAAIKGEIISGTGLESAA